MPRPSLSGQRVVGLPDSSSLQSAARPGSPLVYRKVRGTAEPAGLQNGAIVSRLPVCFLGSRETGDNPTLSVTENAVSAKIHGGFEFRPLRMTDQQIFAPILSTQPHLID